MDENAVREMVRRVVYRTIGRAESSSGGSGRALITEADLREVPIGGEFIVPPGALITPLARQVAMDRRLVLQGNEPPLPEVLGSPGREGASANRDGRVVAVGADHGGYELKETLSAYVAELGHKVIDCGTESRDAVDYPDYAHAVARLVSQGQAWRGIVIDGAGIGSCMAANKVPGVRAAMCYDHATAINSREHNDANVLTLGAGLIAANLAKQIVKVWLETPAGGGRHARRVEKIMQIEKRYLRARSGGEAG